MEVGAKIGHEIMMTVRKLGLPYRMDDVTEGRGNCFPLAVLQQCKREEIRSNLDISTRQITDQDNPTLLRRAVLQFIEKSQHQHHIREFKENYINLVGPIDKKTWEMYWNEMLTDGTWVDSIFVQATAWFLGHDIMITTTTSRKNQPFISICGHINNQCQGEKIIMGCKSNVHYQSLLPIQRNPIQDSRNQVSAEGKKKMPVSKKINQELGGELLSSLERKRIEQNIRKAKSRAKKREENSQKVKDDENRWKAKSRANLKTVDENLVKEEQNRWKAKSSAKQRAIDEKEVKENQKRRKESSRGNLRTIDDKKVKEDQNRHKESSRAKLRTIDD